MPRVAFTRASFPASSLSPSLPLPHPPPPQPPSPSPSLSPSLSPPPPLPLLLMLVLIRAAVQYLFSYASEKIPLRNSDQFAIPNDTRKRNAPASAAIPRFTVHLSAGESPSDKFQVSRLNEHAVLPPPPSVAVEKRRLITRIRVILSVEFAGAHRPTRLRFAHASEKSKREKRNEG